MVDALQDKCPAADRAMAPPLRAVEDSTSSRWKGNPETENGDMYRTAAWPQENVILMQIDIYTKIDYTICI